MIASVERATVIRRSAGDVFAFLAVPENHPRFVPGLIEFTANPPGTGWKVGSSPRAKRKMLGRELTVNYQFTVFEPDHRLGMSGNLGPIAFAGEYVLEPDGMQTRVVFRLKFELHGALVLAKPLLVQMGSSSGAQSLKQLKGLLEASR